MIPYFAFHVIPLGPIAIQVWGLFVALGLLTATWLLARILRRDGRDPELAWNLAFWAMLGAVVGARLGHVFFYDWDYFSAHPGDIIAVWKGGLSSFGGFFGGALAGLAYLRAKKADLLRISDATLAALPLGWAIGRVGCFLIHDHPGTLTNSPFGVRFPDGARFDLGMIDGLVGLLVFAVAYPFHRFIGRRIPGLTTGLVLQLYALLRFLTDFLRATDLPNSDPRYLGLTPAQYACIAFFLIGDVLIVRAVLGLRKRVSPTSDGV